VIADIIYCGYARRRLSHFGKSGGESCLFDALHATVSDTDKKVIIIVRSDRIVLTIC